MKSIDKFMLLCVLFPVAAAAQNQNPNMQGMDMGKLMQAMEEMQQCMAKVDQEELRKLEAEGEEMERELRKLCEQGNRDKAQKEAIKYSKKMMKNPALVQMKECTEITKGLMPEGSMPEEEDFGFDPSRDGHVCDN